MEQKQVKTLRKQLDAVIENYTKTLCERFKIDEAYCYWAADDNTGIYRCADDLFLNLSDVIYIVDNNIERKVVEEWQEYCIFAHDFQQSIPNLPSWVKGCPRLSKGEIKRLKALRDELEQTIKDCQTKY